MINNIVTGTGVVVQAGQTGAATVGNGVIFADADTIVLHSAASSVIDPALNANADVALNIRHTYDDTDLFPAYLTPSAEAQTLEAEKGTAFNKIYLDAIPYSEVSNSYGTTVNIGET